MKKRLKGSLAVAATGVVLAGSVYAWPTGANAQTPGDPVVVASKLNNPRQLSLTSDGVLLAAEAGKGGDECSGEGQQQICIGETGSVAAFFHPSSNEDAKPVRVTTGLISGAGPDGSFAVGVDGVSARRFLDDKIYTQITATPPDAGPVAGEQSGKLMAGFPGSTPDPIADIGKFENDNDPDGQGGQESNPYAVLDMGDHRLVADAAGNDILKVTNDGTVSVFHVFPNITTEGCTTPDPSTGWNGYSPSPQFPGCNFVPTSLALGPDSDIYVGGLASERPGEGQVVRLDHATGEPKRVYSGFTTVTGVALDNAGAIYVSELFAPPSGPDAMGPGKVTRVQQDGQRDSKAVPFPAGLAIDQSRNVYVAAFSTSSENGSPEAPEGAETSGQIWRMKF